MKRAAPGKRSRPHHQRMIGEKRAMTNPKNNSPYRWTQADVNVCLILPVIVGLYVVAVQVWGK